LCLTFSPFIHVPLLKKFPASDQSSRPVNFLAKSGRHAYAQTSHEKIAWFGRWFSTRHFPLAQTLTPHSRTPERSRCPLACPCHWRFCAREPIYPVPFAELSPGLTYITSVTEPTPGTEISARIAEAVSMQSPCRTERSCIEGIWNHLGLCAR